MTANKNAITTRAMVVINESDGLEALWAALELGKVDVLEEDDGEAVVCVVGSGVDCVLGKGTGEFGLGSASGLGAVKKGTKLTVPKLKSSLES